MADLLWDGPRPFQNEQIALVSSRHAQVLVQICGVQLPTRRRRRLDGYQTQELKLLELDSHP